jgi:hypothetical protein
MLSSISSVAQFILGVTFIADKVQLFSSVSLKEQLATSQEID